MDTPTSTSSGSPSTLRLLTVVPWIFLSGMAALAHQTIWFRVAVDVLGAGRNTFARIVGCFFLGLALGAGLAAVWKTPPRYGWLRIALAEVGVGLLALPLFWIGREAAWIQTLPWISGLLPWLFPLLFITTPACLMGLVMPWTLGALQTERVLGTRLRTLLYAVNTLGGVLAIPLVLMVCLPNFGHSQSILLAACLNGCIAVGFLWIHQGTAGTRRQGPSDTPSVPTRSGLLPVHAQLAFGSGFLILAAEVLLQIQVRQITVHSQHSTGAVLGMVLLGLGVAAMGARLFARIVGGERRALSWACLLACWATFLQPTLLMASGGLDILPHEVPLRDYGRQLLSRASWVILPPMLAAGLLFPLLLCLPGLARDTRATAMLFLWNGIGGLLGAELMHRWLAPLLGLWLAMGAVAVGYLILFMRVTETPFSGKYRFGKRALLLLTVVALLGSFRAGARFPHVGIVDPDAVLAHRVGHVGVVAVVEPEPGNRMIVLNNSYTLGGSKSVWNQERQAHLPLLLHGNPVDVACLGLATGSTAAGALQHDTVVRLDAYELSAEVAEFARTYFGEFTDSLFEDPRFRSVIEDARWALARETDRYDVIVGDLFLPWESGAGRMYSVEHLQNVKRALRQDGLFCQWLPLYQLTEDQFQLILNTFLHVFPDTFVVRGDFYIDMPILGLVGGKDLASVSWEGVRTACERLRNNAATRDPLVRHAEGVAMLVVGAPETDPGQGLNTLENARLEWNAGRNIVGMASPWFTHLPLAQWLRDLQRKSGSRGSPILRTAQKAGQFFLTLEVARAYGSPTRSELERRQQEYLPESMWLDPWIDWSAWPAGIKPNPSAVPER